MSAVRDISLTVSFHRDPEALRAMLDPVPSYEVGAEGPVSPMGPDPVKPPKAIPPFLAALLAALGPMVLQALKTWIESLIESLLNKKTEGLS